MNYLALTSEFYTHVKAGDIDWFVQRGFDQLDQDILSQKALVSERNTIKILYQLLDRGYFPSSPIFAILVKIWKYGIDHSDAERILFKLDRQIVISHTVSQLNAGSSQEERVNAYFLLRRLFEGKKMPEDALPGLFYLLKHNHEIWDRESTMDFVTKSIAEFGEPTIPVLRDMLSSHVDWRIVTFIIRTLAAMDGPPQEACDLLLQLCLYEDKDVREEAAKRLNKSANLKLQEQARVLACSDTEVLTMGLPKVRMLMREILNRFADNPEKQAQLRRRFTDFYSHLFRISRGRKAIVELEDGTLSLGLSLPPKRAAFRETRRVFA